ncbi:unnamed protein product, partial [marine sediment metagenome]
GGIMIAVILAAGAPGVDFYKGAQSAFLRQNAERVEKEMKQIEPPKCLFKCRGEVLLERQVRLLRECGIEHIKIITNYKEEMIKEFDRRKKLGLEFIHNSDYRKPFIGLRAAMEKERDCLLVFGDVHFPKNTIEKLIGQRKFVGAVEESRRAMTFGEKVQLGGLKHWNLCKIPDTTEFLVRYATALTYGPVKLENTGSLENLYKDVSRFFGPGLGGLYWVFANYGASTIVDPELLDLDLYELTDDYTERWGVVDQITEGGQVTSFQVGQENHS